MLLRLDINFWVSVLTFTIITENVDQHFLVDSEALSINKGLEGLLVLVEVEEKMVCHQKLKSQKTSISLCQHTISKNLLIHAFSLNHFLLMRFG